MSTEKSGFGRQIDCQITEKALPVICGQCFEKQGENYR